MTLDHVSIAFGFLFLFGTIVLNVRYTMKNVEAQQGPEYANTLYGVWVEILVTYFPFVVYVLVGTFQRDIALVLQTPELAVAAAVLSGQGVFKILHHVINLSNIKEQRDRVVFLTSLGLLFFLLSVAFVILLASADLKPWFSGLAQLILVSLSLPLYAELAGGAALLQKKYGDAEITPMVAQAELQKTAVRLASTLAKQPIDKLFMLTPGYYITAELRVKDPNKVEEAKSALLALCTDTLKEPNCTIFQLHQDEKIPTRFLLWERFDDENAFKAHFKELHTEEFLLKDLTEVVQYFHTNVVL